MRVLAAFLFLFCVIRLCAAANPDSAHIELYDPFPPAYQAKYIPLIVRVENRGGEIRGELNARFVPNIPQFQGFVIPVIQPVIIPSGARQQFSLLVPVPDLGYSSYYGYYNGSTIVVELRHRGQVLDRQKLVPRFSSGPTVLIFSESQRGAATLGNLYYSVNPQYKGTRVVDSVIYADSRDSSLLPSDWRVLKGISTIIMDDFPLERFSPEVEGALYEWVLLGGTLVLFPDAVAQRHSSPFLQQLFVKENSDPFVSDYRESAFGQGNIVIISPASANAMWKDKSKETAWVDILKGRVQQLQPNSSASAIKKKIFASDYIYFLLFFALYVVVVGPGQYLFLRKKGLLNYLFATTALFSVLFFTFFFMVAAIRFGTRGALNQYSLIDLPQGCRQAALVSYGTFFSAQERKYAIHSPLATSLVKQEIRYGSTQGRIPRSIVLERGFTLNLLEIPMWNEETFTVEGVLSFPGSIDLTDSNGKLRLENHTGLVLRDCQYVAGGTIYYLGEVSSTARSFDLSTFSVSNSFLQTASPYNQAWRQQLFLWTNKQDPLWEMQDNMAGFLSKLLFSSSSSALVARVENAPGTLEVNPGTHRVLHEAILVVREHD